MQRKVQNLSLLMLVGGGRRKILGLDSDWISERYPKSLQREPRELSNTQDPHA